jgi:hypothetical protein
MKNLKILFTSFFIFLPLLVFNLDFSQRIKKNISENFYSLKNIAPFSLFNNDIEAVSGYFKNFVKILLKTGFTSDEAKMMLKEGNRILLLEELLEKIEKGESLDKLRDSFKIWHQSDERFLSELKELPPNKKTIFFHQTVKQWLEYHSQIAKKFSEENLSPSQINQLIKEFKINAKNHNIKLKQSFEALGEAKKIFVSVPLIRQAEAVTCGALVPPPFYHFGGRVIPPVHACVLPPVGIINTITPPCGGTLLFSYKILALNPYLWKKPIVGSAVLGKSALIPGACLGAGASPPVYAWEAIVIYFGTSLFP